MRFLNDPAVKSLLENAKPLNAVRADDYAAIFYVGGRGPVLDLPTDKANVRLANEVMPKSQWECLLPYTPTPRSTALERSLPPSAMVLREWGRPLFPSRTLILKFDVKRARRRYRCRRSVHLQGQSCHGVLQRRRRTSLQGRGECDRTSRARLLQRRNRPSRSCSKIASEHLARHTRKQISFGRCVPILLLFMTFPLTQQRIRSLRLCIPATYSPGRTQPLPSPSLKTF